MEPHDFLQLSAANSLPVSDSQPSSLFASDSLQFPYTHSTQSGSLSAPTEAGITEGAIEIIDHSQSLHDEVLDVFGGITQVAAKIAESNPSLHDEVLDVFAGISDVTMEMVEYNQSLLDILGNDIPETPNPVLDSAVTSAKEQLGAFAADEKFLEKMNQAFGEDWRPQKGRALIQDLANGRGEMPELEVLPATDLGGDGAFFEDTIYLSEEFLSENADQSEAVAGILLEELGHYIDQALSRVDSAGDEGEIFARLVQGETLSKAELAELKAEDESTTIVLDGKETPVELAEPEYPGYNLQYDPSAPEYDEDPEIVKLWQQRMDELGYAIGVDGYYGEESAAVATKFQTDQGLTADGIVGPETWDASFGTDDPPPTEPTDINQAGLSLVKEFEGFVKTAYLDPGGVLTIGYGHTGPDVTEGMTITEEQGEQLLVQDLGEAEAGVSDLVTAPLNENQFSALVSFVFNLGSGNLEESTLLVYLNEGNYQAAADEFLKWNTVDGEPLEGLTRRREAERELFLTPPVA